MIIMNAGQAANDDGSNMPPIPYPPRSSSGSYGAPKREQTDSSDSDEKPAEDEPIDISSGEDVDIDDDNEEDNGTENDGGESIAPPAP